MIALGALDDEVGGVFWPSFSGVGVASTVVVRLLGPGGGAGGSSSSENESSVSRFSFRCFLFFAMGPLVKAPPMGGGAGGGATGEGVSPLGLSLTWLRLALDGSWPSRLS